LSPARIDGTTVIGALGATITREARCEEQQTTHYGLIGAGGFGREVMPLLRFQLGDAWGRSSVSFVVETRSTGSEPVGGIPVRDIDNFLSLPRRTVVLDRHW
jgi:hypothetical protein